MMREVLVFFRIVSRHVEPSGGSSAQSFVARRYTQGEPRASCPFLSSKRLCQPPFPIEKDDDLGYVEDAIMHQPDRRSHGNECRVL